MWISRTGEHSPFCTYVLLFSRVDGQCFIPPVVFCQVVYYIQYIHLHLLIYWVFHNTPSGYMHCNICYKVMVK